jgi:transposase
MTDAETWARRVEEWRASGQSSVAYCEGKPFTAGGLRNWAHRLRAQAPRAERPQVRIGRVLVREAVASAPGSPEGPGEASGGAPSADPALVVECGDARVLVRPGFDRASFAAVLGILRGGLR